MKKGDILNYKWKTKLGEEILLKNMEIAHLYRCKEMVQRQVDEIEECVKHAPLSSGELEMYDNKEYLDMLSILEEKKELLNILKKAHKLKFKYNV